MRHFLFTLCSVALVISACKASRRDASETLSSSSDGGFYDDQDFSDYELKDTLGVPFVDTVLGERQMSWNVGAQNLFLLNNLIKRLYHVNWGLAPGFKAMGFDPCFDLRGVFSPNKEPVNTSAWTLVKATPRLLTCLLMRVQMADNSWKTARTNFKPPVVATLFWPNTLTVDLDTNGTWPFGRRPEDQVASRFTALFLNMAGGMCGGKPCNIDSLQDPSRSGSLVAYDRHGPGLPINPVKNDKEFLKVFPYLAEPWPEKAY